MTFQVIGKSVPRVDGADKVTGRALYTADHQLPGTIWGKTLASPYAHARIVNIDTSKARALPGVHAVLTGEDVRAGMYGRAIKDVPVLAYGVVRFVGERVAAVAADDEDIAQEALSLIEVEYEELPAVFDIFDAQAEDAPVLHPDFEGYGGGAEVGRPPNGYSYTVADRGDLDAGFEDADVIIENTFSTQRQHQGYLEPQSCMVSAADLEHVLVWTSSKAPYDTRRAFAAAINVPVESIVFHHSYIGGDFGGKATPAVLPVAHYLSQASGRPVRMILDYVVEEFSAANPRNSTVTVLRTGVKHDGTITAHHSHFYVNVGAYAGYKPGRTIGGVNQTGGPYRIPNTRLECTHVYTNVVPGGHMRAPGFPQASFALESHIDDIALRLSIDPVEFRLKNLIVDGDETAFGHKLQNIRVHETLKAAVDASNYSVPKPANVGRGVAVGEHSPGGGQGNAAIKLLPDGRIVLGTPIFDQGTGTHTTLRQVVAEELGVEPERIEIDVWDTDVVPYDSGIGGSRGTRVATAVAHEAAQNVKQALLSHVAQQLEWSGETLELRGNEVWRENEESVVWVDLLARDGTEVAAEAHVEERGYAPITSFVAQVAEVEVDPETGQVRLLNFTTAVDTGRVLNPMGHQGQINGGLMQGLGYTLMEDLRIEDGRVTSLSFGDYKIPTMRDIPPHRTVLLEAEAGGVGPYQIKGVGESAIVPVAAAIANAVADALGVRIRDLPITAEKVYQALKK